MELALNKTPMEGYACPLETVLYLEETQESIVPDACPDIGRLLSTRGWVRLTEKECKEGKLECAGSVQLTVVYLPDGEEGPRRIELTVPFHCAAAGGFAAGCPAVVVPRLTGAETRVLNPRKVLCRVELAVTCQVWTPREEVLCQPREDGEFSLEQKVEELESYTAVAVAEKAFAFTDDVVLPPSHPRMAELLDYRLELHCGEAKVIGSKLIFKGEAVLQCGYRTGEDALATGRWELPFSQIVELDGVEEEEGSCTIDIVQRECQVTPTGDEEGRTLSVHLELLAQGVVRQTRQVKLFADAYSITHDLTVERQSCQLVQLWEESGLNQTLREVLETDAAVQEVEDCTVTLGPCLVAREEQEGVVTAKANVSLIFTDGAGALQSIQRTVPLTARLALPMGGECRCRCALSGEVQALATAGGIELRCPVRFSYLTTVTHSREAVTALTAEEREGEEQRPSVCLRLVQPGEGLWDIAKDCCAARADILTANGLSGEEPLEGAMLLIPRSR